MAATSGAFLLLSLSCLIHSAAGYQPGIVGYGISLYQDLCCQACHDSLSSLYLSCTTFGDDDMGDMGDMDMGDMGDMGPMGTTSPECYANNTAWLQTMAYCIQQNCNADGYPGDKQAECFSVQALAGASTPTFHDSLPATPPTIELASDATWLNVTSLVNPDLYYSTHGTLGEFARQEYLHTKYSLVVYLVVIGIIVAYGLLAQFASLLPKPYKQLQASAVWSKLQSSVFFPALLGSRRLEPLPGQAGYLPGRALSIFIGVYVVLNVVFSAVSFGTFSPNIWFMSPQFETCEYVGNRTGTLSLVNMSIAILFAGRNNLLIALTGWSQTAFMALHRWTARVATVQAVVHSIAYTVAYFEPGYEGAAAYAAKAAEPFYYWGIIATIAMSLAVAFAVLPLRISFYESFLLLHIALVILALVGCWYHLVPHFGFDYGYQVWLYLCFAFWSADRLARLARVAYYNPLGGSKALVEAIPDCDVLQITIFPRAATASAFGPAQHTFVYISGLPKFWESHPFSIAAWTPISPSPTSPSTSSGSSSKEPPTIAITPSTPSRTTPSIRLLIRPHTGATSRLQSLLHKSSPSTPLSLTVYTEGPYAGHRATLHPLHAADTVLCVVGGIGVTHILGFLQHLRERGQKSGGESRAQRVVLAWSARERGLLEYVRREFLTDLEGKGVEGLFWCTGEVGGGEGKAVEEGGCGSAAAEVRSGRMDVGEVLRGCVEAGSLTSVLVCAPGGMADEVTRQVVKCVREGFRVDLVEEAFAW